MIETTDMFEKLHDIVEKQLNKEERETYEKNKGIFEDVKRFAIKKKLVLYGGMALNELLPKKHKFYDAATMPDYDMFSPNAQKDAIDLAKILVKKGWGYVEVKAGLHEGTFKVYAEFLSVADITQVSKRFHAFLVKESKSNPKKNQSDPDLYISCPTFLLWSFYKELSRPQGSLFRWEKVFKRYLIFQKQFRLKPSKPLSKMKFVTETNKDVLECQHELQKLIKEKGLIVVGTFALGLYKGMNKGLQTDCCRVLQYFPAYDILTNDPIVTYETIEKHLKLPSNMKLGGLQFVDPLHLKDIMPYRYRISLIVDGVDYPFFRIFEASDGCYSVNKIHGYKVGTVDTVLHYMYSYHLGDLVWNNKKEGHVVADLSKDLICMLENYIDKAYKNEPTKRFSTACEGIEKSMTNVRIERWDKKPFAYRPKQKESEEIVLEKERKKELEEVRRLEITMTKLEKQRQLDGSNSKKG